MKYEITRNGTSLYRGDDLDKVDKLLEAFFVELGNKVQHNEKAKEDIEFHDKVEGVKLTTSFAIEHMEKEQTDD